MRNQVVCLALDDRRSLNLQEGLDADQRIKSRWVATKSTEPGCCLLCLEKQGKGRQTLFYIQSTVRDKVNRKPRRGDQRGGRTIKEVTNL